LRGDLLARHDRKVPDTDASGNETKTFFASTLDAARAEARHWVSTQTDIRLTIDSTHRKSNAGGWMLTVYFQRRAKATP
jgi:hypothetical protein